MVESNKILTVSYGTFSCTLEGFDDAFDTMKAIAEYFRDLAADDRYFGAEPPTPDADMLARLAERSISRRVTARSEDGNIVLSPDARQAEAEPAPQPVAEAAPAPAAAPTPTPAPAPIAEVAAQDEDEEEAPQPRRAPRIAAALAAAGGAALLAAAPAPARAEAKECATEEETTEDLPDDGGEAPLTAAAPEAEVEAVPEDAIAPDENAPDVITLGDLSLDTPDHVAPEAAEDIGPAPATADDAFETLLAETLADSSADRLDDTPVAAVPEEMMIDTPAPQDEDNTAPEAVQEDAEADTLDSLLAGVEAEDTAEAALDALLLDSPMNAPEAAPQAQAEDDLSEALAFTDTADSSELAPTAALADDEAEANPEADVDLPPVAAQAVTRPPLRLVDLAPLAPAQDDAPEATAPDDSAAEDLAPEETGAPLTHADTDPLDDPDPLDEAEAALAAACDGADRSSGMAPAAPDASAVAGKRRRIQDVLAGPVAAPLAGPELPSGGLSFDEGDDLPSIADDEAAFSSTIGAGDGAEDLALDPEAPSLFDEPAEAAAAPRVMARVVKVQRAPEESSLSPEDEAELQRELAALEDEIARSNADTGLAPLDAEDEDAVEPLDLTAPAAQADPAPAPRAPARETLQATDHASQMDRILRETDHHFEREDSTRRRSALAHLRAAVAAKKAEKAAGSDFAAREDTTDAYREDLAQVVRPRRPVVQHHSEAAPRRQENRPAPLKLVAEQRVDLSGQPRGPVRPRRISVADLARHDGEAGHRSAPAPQPTQAPDQSFEDYAAAVGAGSLGELLEAAASYISFLEGQPLFSRPQLMTRVKTLAPNGFSREDGLRAFGQLLRDGKIRKAEAGRFTVSDSIGFRPEERAAG